MENVLKYGFDRPHKDTLNAYGKKYQMDTTVQKVLDTDGELPAEEYNSLFGKIMEKKKWFLDGDKKDKALATRDLNTKAEAVKAYKSFRQDLASAYNTKALMNGWVDSKQGSSVMSLLRDEARLIEKVCPKDVHCPDKNELGIIMPDFKAVDEAEKRINELNAQFSKIKKWEPELKNQYIDAVSELEGVIKTGGEKWVSISNLKNFIKLKDSTTRDVLKTMGNNYIQQSTRTNPSDNIKFNKEAAERQVRSTVVNKTTNKQSLVFDEMVPGRIFYNDMVDKIRRTTPWGKNQQDVEMIANAIVNNPEHEKMLDDELVEYYTGYVQRQWDTGIANRPNPVTKNKEKPITKNETDPGGSVDRKIQPKSGLPSYSGLGAYKRL